MNNLKTIISKCVKKWGDDLENEAKECQERTPFIWNVRPNKNNVSEDYNLGFSNAVREMEIKILEMKNSR